MPDETKPPSGPARPVRKRRATDGGLAMLGGALCALSVYFGFMEMVAGFDGPGVGLFEHALAGIGFLGLVGLVGAGLLVAVAVRTRRLMWTSAGLAGAAALVVLLFVGRVAQRTYAVVWSGRCALGDSVFCSAAGGVETLLHPDKSAELYLTGCRLGAKQRNAVGTVEFVRHADYSGICCQRLMKLRPADARLRRAGCEGLTANCATSTRAACERVERECGADKPSHNEYLCATDRERCDEGAEVCGVADELRCAADDAPPSAL